MGPAWPSPKIPDLTRMQVSAILWDVDDGTLAPGMEARCTLDAFPSRHFEGRISDITPVAQEVRRLSLRRGFTVLIDLGQVDPEIARPGMSIHVDIAPSQGSRCRSGSPNLPDLR